MAVDMAGDNPGLITLTDAAERTGYSRDALRQRVRRGRLPHVKGNDGVIRVRLSDLDDLPPSLGEGEDVAGDDQGQTTADVLAATLADLGRIRDALDREKDARLIDHGRAERAMAQAEAEQRRAEAAEARAEKAEAALAEARMPWLVKVVRAIRG